MQVELKGSRWPRTALASITLLATTIMPASAVDATLDSDYGYVVIDQDVRDTLREFAFDKGIPLDLSAEVRGRIKGRVDIANGRELLNRVALASRSVWYYDGKSIVVRSAAALQSRRFSAMHLTKVQRDQVIEDLGATGHGVELSYDAQKHELVASGPAEYVQAVGRALHRPAQSRGTAVEVVRFRTR
jgi:hypothetical protein